MIDLCMHHNNDGSSHGLGVIAVRGLSLSHLPGCLTMTTIPADTNFLDQQSM